MLIMSKKTKKQRKIYIKNDLQKTVDRKTVIDIKPIDTDDGEDTDGELSKQE